jgi:hypothetical protein
MAQNVLCGSKRSTVVKKIEVPSKIELKCKGKTESIAVTKRNVMKSGLLARMMKETPSMTVLTLDHKNCQAALLLVSHSVCIDP